MGRIAGNQPAPRVVTAPSTEGTFHPVSRELVFACLSFLAAFSAPQCLDSGNLQMTNGNFNGFAGFRS